MSHHISHPVCVFVIHPVFNSICVPEISLAYSVCVISVWKLVNDCVLSMAGSMKNFFSTFLSMTPHSHPSKRHGSGGLGQPLSSPAAIVCVLFL